MAYRLYAPAGSDVNSNLPSPPVDVVVWPRTLEMATSALFTGSPEDKTTWPAIDAVPVRGTDGSRAG